jgi:uncharacterized membrane protein
VCVTSWGRHLEDPRPDHRQAMLGGFKYHDALNRILDDVNVTACSGSRSSSRCSSV